MSATPARAQDTSEPPPDRVLTLPECLDLAVEHNPDIRAALEAWKEVEGQGDVERSRFHPRFGADSSWRRDRLLSSITTTIDKNVGLSYKQRLLEFGREAAGLKTVRADRRRTWAQYQDETIRVLAEVREAFHLIVNRQRQIEDRRRNLATHQANLERAQARFEAGQVIKADVLTAELSVREEELRINTLRRVVFRQTMDLLDLLGQPLGVRVAVSGGLPEFPWTEEEVVAAALGSSTKIAVLEGELADRKLALDEAYTLGWPDLAVSAGAENKSNQVQLDLSSAGNQVWGVDLSAGRFFERDNTRFAKFGNLEDGKFDYFVSLSVEVPIFDGGKRRGQVKIERARLAQADAALIRERLRVELEARKAWQDFLEASEELRIQSQTVAIAEERLRIMLELRERGRAAEDVVENFRGLAFREQDDYFRQQDEVIRAQEKLRRLMRRFED